MELILMILVIINVTIIILNLIINKKKDNLIEEILDLNIRLTSERSKVKDILIRAEITKENYFETIEKIKKELDVSKTY